MKKKSFWDFLNFWKTSPNPYTPQPIFPDKKRSIKIQRTNRMRVLPELESFQSAVLSATDRNIQDRQMLFGLYWQALNLDPYVSALMNKRLENLLGKKTILTVGEEQWDTGDFFNAPKWQQFLKDVLITKFWGFSVFEFNSIPWGDTQLFDYFRLPNVHFNPYLQEVLERPNDHRGTPLNEYPDALFVGDPDDLGQLLQITRLYIEKSNATSHRLRYSELASENFVIETYKTYDPNVLKQSQDAMEERGTGSHLQKPDDRDVELHNQSSSQQNQLFKDLLDDYKKELSIFILGQTMTTEDGSSRSQAEVHQEEQDKKMLSDIQYIENFLNYDMLPYLQIWLDFPMNGAKLHLEEPGDIHKKRDIYLWKELRDLGIQWTDEELREHFNELISTNKD